MTILTKLENQIVKAVTQNQVEEQVFGKVLDHQAGNGYCFLLSLLYGVEELGPYDMDKMVEKLKATPLATDYFNKGDGSVGDAGGLVSILTEKRFSLKRLYKTENLNVLRNMVLSAESEHNLFFLAHLPGHYIYVRMNGDYSNPLGDRPVNTSKVKDWQLWKVLSA